MLFFTISGIEKFLLYTSDESSRKIGGLNVLNPQQQVLPIVSNVASAAAVDFYDGASQHLPFNVYLFSNCACLLFVGYIYWADRDARLFARMRRDLSDRQIFMRGDVIGVEDMAIDWTTGVHARLHIL